MRTAVAAGHLYGRARGSSVAGGFNAAVDPPTAGSSTTALITGAGLHADMPATLEVVCTDDDCELDMFELHYTYDMPDDVGVADFNCPYCGGVDHLEAIEL
jgi:hypothetical protein